ncbi:MAG: hypothetical protein ACRDYC_05890 [Acidimicrobiales bacterium]
MTDVFDAITLEIEAWQSQFEGQGTVAASLVQDRLLDLWGSLPEGKTREEVQGWLTETLGRSRYSAEDIADRLGVMLRGA